MIDAANITDYNLNYEELEARIIFWILAAGKNGTRAAKIINAMIDFWQKDYPGITPFSSLFLYDMEETKELCKYYKTGCHSHKAKSLYQICRADLDLKTCSVEDLESIYGIGMKTSRCFIIHSREDAECAGLDTHMLKYLASLGYDVPKSTPSRKLYLTLEKIVIKLAKEKGMSPADFDLAVWNSYKVVDKAAA